MRLFNHIAKAKHRDFRDPGETSAKSEKTLWVFNQEQTSLLAKCFVENQYHTHRSCPMSPTGRRAFLDQVETLLEGGADPNITICAYDVGERVLHRLLGDQNSNAGLMWGWLEDDAIVVVSEQARLKFLLTPFLDGLFLDDVNLIVLLILHGANVRDLTRGFMVNNQGHDWIQVSALRFESIRDFARTVDIMRLQADLIGRILWAMDIFASVPHVSYCGMRLVSMELQAKMYKRRTHPITLSGIVWSFSFTPHAVCLHVRHRTLDVDQEGLIASTASSSAMCSMCRLVDSHRYDATALPPPDPRVSLVLRHIRETQGYQLISVRASEERRHVVGFVPSAVDAILRKVSPSEDRSTGSLAAIMLSKHWLINCAETHVTCQDQGSTYVPTRLVEILDDGMIRIVEYTSSVRMYAALSHRWDRDDGSKTTSLNFAERLFPFPADQLSPTLRDSLKAVQSLGYSYLWIDMICIIQDSKEDWLCEAANMRYVYSNAVITIAAERTGNEIAGRGIFLPRDLRGSRPFPLHQLENYIGEQLEPLFQSPQNPEDKHLYIFPDAGEEQHGIRPKGVLDTRGWILQEQLLSPRILYYGQQQLYWDCISQSASEVSPMAASLLNDSNSGETWAFRQIRQTIAGKGNPEMLARLIADVWIYIVRNYSARSLTKPSDKLIAIQGVITALENVLNLSSVAGMWEQDLWKQLTWWVAHSAIATASATPPFPAPTWSWLSVDGAVSHYHSMRMHKDPVQLDDLAPLPDLRCTITNVLAESTSVSAILHLSAPSFFYTLTANDLREPIWKRGHPRKLHLAPARWMLDRQLEMPLAVQCVIIAEDEVAKMTVGMCLVAHDSQPDTWKRAGVFLWDGQTWQIAKYAGKELQIEHFAVI